MGGENSIRYLCEGDNSQAYWPQSSSQEDPSHSPLSLLMEEYSSPYQYERAHRNIDGKLFLSCSQEEYSDPRGEGSNSPCRPFVVFRNEQARVGQHPCLRGARGVIDVHSNDRGANSSMLEEEADRVHTNDRVADDVHSKDKDGTDFRPIFDKICRELRQEDLELTNLLSKKRSLYGICCLLMLRQSPRGEIMERCISNNLYEIGKNLDVEREDRPKRTMNLKLQSAWTALQDLAYNRLQPSDLPQFIQKMRNTEYSKQNNKDVTKQLKGINQILQSLSSVQCKNYKQEEIVTRSIRLQREVSQVMSKLERKNKDSTRR